MIAVVAVVVFAAVAVWGWAACRVAAMSDEQLQHMTRRWTEYEDEP